ncbi:MAG: hypothetical protein A2725_02275 [Candidatus Magasanikbacteria bacterium RIFCSPHIGHO2_01_FULL_33_34]|uniref:Uncharacterized protein n=1 Tax=Candidatus Magasanikbacteria bacterium RIFCSPHIGHO2_01_FULL_33_34 TaxID=1798671 RepID=A0A1F6LKA9_9BACT|nr:MAG: hypothetical protein A2725_02275 [Candidatus Magasanikbacteria bacterium RIFCSPHIGHO2_01_FULL_33_34]OGH65650.1 MAG: hypothetical protein A3B83_02125 [Candidatus Magasanikbacteria bacterium RIFCSPHIGHO2_02_FULL_33_17]OGH75859.1 MAG: hypothetical protein A3A89_03020 [Candidatus Magasanikbacteria bacterium RIFCSPLOWO2_01_FULL_33_34]OGH81843.1 MAG: hypothetical protein A3F93_00260 [Candidatus Magasanikbacteria bacterium RIFCSPLOWO2_12_FULL_34_7]
MEKKPTSSSSIFERLRLMKKCPFCEYNYEAKKVVVLEEYEESRLVHVTCSDCNSSILHIMLVTQVGLNTMGIITDLSAEEVKRLRYSSGITEDILLDFHKFLYNSNNSFSKLILDYI